ncbi:MAG TPA: hypothetical protein VEK13_03830 [Thermoplasmata archaeon]|nr:hypothetical protein [Thermoplasmata archaeon]
MDLPLPPLPMPPDPLAYVIIAVAMVAITIFVLGKILPADGRPPLLTQLTLGLSVIFGGSILLLSLLYVFLNSNGTTTWTFVLLAFNFMMMVPAGLWFVSLILFRDRRISAQSWSWPAVLALDTAGAEVIMGILFAYGGSSTPLSVLTSFALGLTSVWFLWSMAAVMGAILLWAPVSRLERGSLFGLTLAAVVAPWVTPYPTVGGILMGVLMAGLFGTLLRRLLRGSARPEEARFLLGLSAAFLAMTVAGLSVAATQASPIAAMAFGGVMVLVMGIESAYLFWRFYHGPRFPALVRRATDEGTNATESAARPIASGDPGAMANR